MGEMTENLRTFVVPNAGQITFGMKFLYDTWNRTKKITYADGEMVRYKYDHNGQLIRMSGVKGSYNSTYVEDMQYDKFGNRLNMIYGNGIKTAYSYDPYNRRLQTLLGKNTNTGDTLQYVNYTYDKADNITDIEKYATRGVDGNKYNVGYQYTYDSLYRVTSSLGDINNSTYGYEHSMTYSPSGNIITKNVDAYISTVQDGDVEVHDYYLYSFIYNQYTTPHAMQWVVYNDFCGYFNWDYNGNLDYYSKDWEQRQMGWDEENRLKAENNYSETSDQLSSYLYNASGDRTLKMQGPMQMLIINGEVWSMLYDISDYTLYSNPYSVMTSDGYTKHYYIEGDRVASKTGGGMANSPYSVDDPVYGFDVLDNDDYADIDTGIVHMIARDLYPMGFQGNSSYGYTFEPDISFWLNDAPEMDQQEANIYYYNKDQLGSSQVITDANTNVVHHIEYMPYGEDFYEKRDSWATPYKFNGKEKDEETGMYYYGARYYSPELSMWLSVDPMSDKRPNQSPFMYCSGNPVILIDPSGLLDGLVITGPESEAATVQLQQGAPNLKPTKGPDDRISYEGIAVTDNEKKLQAVIDDPNIDVNINALNSNRYIYNGETCEMTGGGAFMGNTVYGNTAHTKMETPFGAIEFSYDYNTVNASQFVNPDHLTDVDTYGTPGQSILHEATEAYSGALISQKTGNSASPAITKGNTHSWIYDEAHKATTTVPQPRDGKLSEDDIFKARLLRKN